MKCDKCGHSNPSDTNFCGRCGDSLVSQGETVVYSPETLSSYFQEIPIGTVFADRYEVVDELGRGGMGTVYRVLDRKIKEKVALKLIKPEISFNNSTLERFRNELKLARKITHKNVCRMYDLGEDGPWHFITMEFISGQDLKKMIRMSRQLSVGTAVSIAKQICDGLSESHNLGVIHRDLKPQNIMIDADGNVKIMDFGIARSLSTKGVTMTGVLIGTPEYMSPEQALAKDVDHRTDIYSLGIMLYEMVTGQVPFSGDTPFSVAIKHKDEIPRDPRTINALIPNNLSGVILKCLEKEKGRRYQSMEDLKSDLNRIEQGLPTIERMIPKRPPLTSRDITVTFQFKKLLIPIIVSMILLASVVGIWRPWRRSDVESPFVQVETDISPPSFRVAAEPAPPAGPQRHAPSRKSHIPENVRVFNRDSVVTEAVKSIVGLSSQLSPDNLSELEKVGMVLQMLKIDTKGLLENASTERLARYSSKLTSLGENISKSSAYSKEWNEVNELMRQGQEFAKNGKKDEAAEKFSTAEDRMQKLFDTILNKQSADMARKSVIRGRNSSSESEKDLLKVLTNDLHREAEAAYQQNKFAESRALYNLHIQILSLTENCDDPRNCMLALQSFTSRKRVKLSGTSHSESFARLYQEAMRAEQRGSRALSQQEYEAAGHHFLQALIQYEKAALN